MRTVVVYEATRMAVTKTGAQLAGKGVWLNLRWILGSKKALMLVKAVWVFLFTTAGGVIAVIAEYARKGDPDPLLLRRQLETICKSSSAELSQHVEMALSLDRDNVMECPPMDEWRAFVAAQRSRFADRSRVSLRDPEGKVVKYCPPSRHQEGAELRRHLRRLDLALLRPGGWSEDERQQAADAAGLVRDFVIGLATEAKTSDDVKKCLRSTVECERGRHLPVFHATREALLRPQQGYDNAVQIAQSFSTVGGLPAAGPSDEAFGSALAQHWERCAPVQPLVDAICLQLADEYGGVTVKAPLKTLFRGAEKAALKKQGNPGRVRDVARGAIEFDTMQGIADALLSLVQTSGSGAVHVLRVQDRLSAPAPGGWSDIKVSIGFRGLPGVVAELQLTHKYLGMVRAGMASHESYAASRSADELLRLCGEEVSACGSMQQLAV